MWPLGCTARSAEVRQQGGRLDRKAHDFSVFRRDEAPAAGSVRSACASRRVAPARGSARASAAGVASSSGRRRAARRGRSRRRTAGAGRRQRRRRRPGTGRGRPRAWRGARRRPADRSARRRARRPRCARTSESSPRTKLRSQAQSRWSKSACGSSGSASATAARRGGRRPEPAQRLRCAAGRSPAEQRRLGAPSASSSAVSAGGLVAEQADQALAVAAVDARAAPARRPRSKRRAALEQVRLAQQAAGARREAGIEEPLGQARARAVEHAATAGRGALDVGLGAQVLEVDPDRRARPAPAMRARQPRAGSRSRRPRSRTSPGRAASRGVAVQADDLDARRAVRRHPGQRRRRRRSTGAPSRRARRGRRPGASRRRRRRSCR